MKILRYFFVTIALSLLQSCGSDQLDPLKQSIDNFRCSLDDFGEIQKAIKPLESSIDKMTPGLVKNSSDGLKQIYSLLVSLNKKLGSECEFGVVSFAVRGQTDQVVWTNKSAGKTIHFGPISAMGIRLSSYESGHVSIAHEGIDGISGGILRYTYYLSNYTRKIPTANRRDVYRYVAGLAKRAARSIDDPSILSVSIEERDGYDDIVHIEGNGIKLMNKIILSSTMLRSEQKANRLLQLFSEAQSARNKEDRPDFLVSDFEDAVKAVNFESLPQQ